MMDFAELDAIAEDYWQPGGQPGLAFGVVRDGELVHSGGFGQRFLGGEGMLALDDLAETYVPEMRGWPPVTPDSPRVSVRHLLTMTAGFPADDAWADRQQGLPLDDFSALLSGGVSFA